MGNRWYSGEGTASRKYFSRVFIRRCTLSTTTEATCTRSWPRYRSACKQCHLGSLPVAFVSLRSRLEGSPLGGVSSTCHEGCDQEKVSDNTCLLKPAAHSLHSFHLVWPKQDANTRIITCVGSCNRAAGGADHCFSSLRDNSLEMRCTSRRTEARSASPCLSLTIMRRPC